MPPPAPAWAMTSTNRLMTAIIVAAMTRRGDERQTRQCRDSDDGSDVPRFGGAARKAKVTLEGMLEKDAILDYRQMKTGEKYLVTPWG